MAIRVIASDRVLRFFPMGAEEAVVLDDGRAGVRRRGWGPIPDVTVAAVEGDAFGTAEGSSWAVVDGRWTRN